MPLSAIQQNEFRSKYHPFVDVSHTDYGAKLDGVADDTEAVLLAAEELQSLGTGILLINGNCRIGSTDFQSSVPAGPLFSFTGLSGVKIIILGTLNVDRAFTPGVGGFGQNFCVFSFTDCNGVTLEVVNAISPGAGNLAGEAGPTLANYFGGCRNVVQRSKATNFFANMIVTAAVGAADSARTMNVEAHLDNENCLYGYVGQFSGDNLKATINSNSIGRSLFLYGMANARALVRSINNQKDDVLLRGYEGYGLENIKLKYRNVGSTTAQTAAPCVSIAPDVNASSGLAPVTMSGLDIDAGCVYGPAGGPGHLLSIYKTVNDATQEAVDRGHVLEDVTIRLRGKGGNQPNSAYPMLVSGYDAPVNDKFLNWRVKKVNWRGATSSVFITLPPLRDVCTVENVVSDGYVYLDAGALGGRMKLINCQAPVLGARANTSLIDYDNCTITTAAEVPGGMNKTFRNTKINGALWNHDAGDYVATTNGVAVALFALPGEGTWDVAVTNQGAGTAVHGRVTVTMDGAGNVSILRQDCGASCSFSVSGASLQYTQTSGSGVTIRWAAKLLA